MALCTMSMNAYNALSAFGSTPPVTSCDRASNPTMPVAPSTSVEGTNSTDETVFEWIPTLPATYKHLNATETLNRSNPKGGSGRRTRQSSSRSPSAGTGSDGPVTRLRSRSLGSDPGQILSPTSHYFDSDSDESDPEDHTPVTPPPSSLVVTPPSPPLNLPEPSPLTARPTASGPTPPAAHPASPGTTAPYSNTPGTTTTPAVQPPMPVASAAPLHPTAAPAFTSQQIAM